MDDVSFALVGDPVRAIAYSRSAIGNALSDHDLTDSHGEPFNLGSARGRPLVVSMVFTACDVSCPVIIETLADAVRDARGVLGPGSFSVVTIGFDTRNDTPEMMRSFAKAHGVSDDDWTFLSGDADTISAIMRELGFIATGSPRGYDHVSQVSVVDADGVVRQHVYGASFESPALVEPLKQLTRGGPFTRLSGVEAAIEKIRLFCTFYDPRTGRYEVDYSIVLSIIIGSVILLLMGGVIARALFNSWRAGV